MHRLTAAILIGILLALAPGQCSAQPAARGGNSPAGHTVVFIAEVFSAQGEPLARIVSLTVTAFQANGEIASAVDPQSGKVAYHQPLVMYRKTPWRHTSTLTPGIVGVSFTVDYFGIKGEIVQCYGTVDGSEVSRSANQIKSTGPGGRGGESAHCVYMGG
jgi:hypothetical protein